MTARHRVYIPPGLTWRWRVVWKREAEPVDLAGHSAVLTVANAVDTEVLRLESGTPGLILGGVPGGFDFWAPVSTTQALGGSDGSYHLHVTTPEGDTDALVCGPVVFAHPPSADSTGIVIVERETVTVVSAAVPGPRGPAGGGASAIEHPFGWGDASPAIVGTLPAGAMAWRAEIVITEAFDGAGAALALGDAAVPDRLISPDRVDPGLAATFATAPAWSPGADTPILLTITPGAGASRGAGFVRIIH
jgi:hypothetical protein